MRSFILALAASIGTALAAQAHFVFVVPQADGKVQVVFSDDLGPDENVSIEKIAKLPLKAVLADGKTVDIPLKAEKHHLAGDIGATKPQVLCGSLNYAVMQKGMDKPYLLMYHPKAVTLGTNAAEAARPLKTVVEIVPIVEGGKVKFQALRDGVFYPYAEITVILPTGSEQGKRVKEETGKAGLTKEFSEKGTYGAWVKYAEPKAGESDGKKYEEVRHYATLTFELANAAVPDLPESFSSFGAATSDGYVYVYGGHAGKTHSYSVETTLGKFRRINIADTSKGWEELPGSTKIQGLALVAHKGIVYRVGGMEPRNAMADKSDNHSIATVQAYDPKVGKWANLPDMPSGRSSHDAVVVGDTLYVVGGWCMNGAGKDSVWHETGCSLDLADSKAAWKEFKHPFSRRALTAAAFNGKVYVIAGLMAKGGMERGCNIYDPKTGEWTAGPTLPEGRMNGFTPATVVVGDQLLVNPADGKIYRLKGSEWEAVSQVKTPRWVARAVPFGEGKMLVLAGATGDGSVGTCELIDVK